MRFSTQKSPVYKQGTSLVYVDTIQQEQRQLGIIRPSILVNNKSITLKSKRNFNSLLENNKPNFSEIPVKMSKKIQNTVKF
jgi:hypothetical protein